MGRVRKVIVYSLKDLDGKELMRGDATEICDVLGIETRFFSSNVKHGHDILGMYTAEKVGERSFCGRDDTTQILKKLFPGDMLEEWRYLNKRYGKLLFTTEMLREWNALNKRYGTRI